MEKLNYEYKIVTEQDTLTFVEAVNALGKDGWRIINYSPGKSMQALLERPAEPVKREAAEGDQKQSDERPQGAQQPEASHEELSLPAPSA